MEGNLESCANHVFHAYRKVIECILVVSSLNGVSVYSVAITKHAKQNAVNVLHSNKTMPKLRFI